MRETNTLSKDVEKADKKQEIVETAIGYAVIAAIIIAIYVITTIVKS